MSFNIILKKIYLAIAQSFSLLFGLMILMTRTEDATQYQLENMVLSVSIGFIFMVMGMYRFNATE